MNRIQRLAFAAMLLLCGGAASGQDYQIEIAASGLDHPWSIAWLPDGRALVTERPGRLRVIDNGELLETPIGGVPDVYAASQGALFEPGSKACAWQTRRSCSRPHR